MPQCKNDKTKSYKGTEPSPKGLGYCAHAEKLGQKRIGKDKNMWIVINTKNNVKKWIKYTYDNIIEKLNKLDEDEIIKLNDQLDDYYKKNLVCKNIQKYFINIKKELLANGVHLIIDNINERGNFCGSGSVLSDIIDDNNLSIDDVILWFCIRAVSIDILYNKEKIYLYFNSKNIKNKKEKIYEILKKYCKVEWDLSSKKAIIIEIPKNIIDKDKKEVTKLLNKLI